MEENELAPQGDQEAAVLAAVLAAGEESGQGGHSSRRKSKGGQDGGRRRSSSKGSLSGLTQDAAEGEELSEEARRERRERKERKRAERRASSKASLSLSSSPSQDLAAHTSAGAEDEDDIEAMMAEEELQVNKLSELQVVTEDPEEAKDGKKGKKGKKGGKKGAKKDADERRVSYFALFRFADWLDITMIVIACVSAVGHGVLMPLFAIFFGDVVDAFQVTADPSASPGDFAAVLTPTVNEISVKFVILAAVACVTSFLQVSLLMFAGQRQANRIRQIYFRALLSQEVGWYDVHETGELTTRISGDIILIQDAISEKLGTFLQMFTMFIAGFVVGFIEGWQLSLVILSVVPLLAICGAIMGKLISDFTNDTQKSYGKAGGVAEEVISSMRTVAAFGGEQLERNRYTAALHSALKAGIKKSHSAGAGMGVTMFVMFGSYALAFWYGNELIGAGKMSAGQILAVFFGVLIGAMSIGQTAPAVSAFGAGTGAATKIFEVIERRSKIDSLSDEGLKPETARGEIEFRNVQFTYPSRPDQPILHGISFKLHPGQTLAFVGPSGCGKSTSIALLERFYDPTEGEILFDGCEVRQLSIKWLRSQIGLVSQEPVLFNKTIAENITFGMTNVPQEEIERACRMANAHDFIKALPQGYQTMVGERGTQLSGGQKQRIAIARALIRDPKVLLLDEATSALDNNSEKVVQDALDKASKGRSTIVIAHRLSTIRNADIICVVEKGRIIEQGTHDELMAKPGKSLYQELVKLQEIAGKEDTPHAQGKGGSLSPSKAASPGKTAAEKVPSKKVSARTATEPTEEKEMASEEKQALAKGVVWRSFRLNMPEFHYIFFGAVGAIGNGIVFPVFSLIFGEVLFDLLSPDEDYRNRMIAQWCLVFLGLAVGIGLANYFQTAFFGVSGERLTHRLRNMLFSSIVRQDIGWFDEDKNATGILSTKLATDASQVKGMTGERIGIFLQLFSTIVSGLIIALIACWQLALVVLACVPLVGVSGFMELKLMTGFNQEAKKAYETSGQIASEALMNIRTVFGLGVQGEFMGAYRDSLVAPYRGSRKTAVVAGAGYSGGETMQFMIWALAFWYGARLAVDGKCQFDEMMKAIGAILFGAMMIGQIASFMPDFGKAKAAAASIYAIIDRAPVVDSFSQEGTKLPQVSGTIEFRNVHFHYPTRPSAKILKGLSFTLKPGQTLALVGPSGCGKSTSVSLIERFYNPAEGQILLDGVEVRSLNVSWLRRQIGLVGQEPVLFGTSIKENIAYGKEGQATDQEVHRAAMMANAHKFIQALGSKYDTDVGEKGSQLSGGQKQRVAIARALIRDPKILLLDEATSALDSESEKIVQNALNRARKGRTTIVIAHRLSTIQNADQIAVVDQGIVVEQGTHFELLQKRGLYYRLVNQRVDPL